MLSEISYKQTQNLSCTGTWMHRIYWDMAKSCRFISNCLWHTSSVYTWAAERLGLDLFNARVCQSRVWRGIYSRYDDGHMTSGILSDGMPPSFREAGWAGLWIRSKHFFSQTYHNRHSWSAMKVKRSVSLKSVKVISCHNEKATKSPPQRPPRSNPF